MLRRAIRRAVRDFTSWLYRDDEPPRHLLFDDFAYPELNLHVSAMLREGLRAQYGWGAVHAASLAASLGYDRVSLLEFGVAGGNGLIALERIADRVERLFPVKIEVYGFDTGAGLPQVADLRDGPNMASPGLYRMDPDKLRSELHRAQLVLGNIKDTIGRFVASSPAPVGFLACDLVLYSSTVSCLRLLDAPDAVLLPRIVSYFDDVLGFSWGDCNGERLAIHEFNAAHETRKISPLYGMKHYVPPECFHDMWVDKYWMTHIFDHPKYAMRDHLVKQHNLALPS